MEPVRTWPLSVVFRLCSEGDRGEVGELVGEKGGGWMGGCGALGSPRVSGFGQEAERVGFNAGSSSFLHSVRLLKESSQVMF